MIIGIIKDLAVLAFLNRALPKEGKRELEDALRRNTDELKGIRAQQQAFGASMNRWIDQQTAGVFPDYGTELARQRQALGLPPIS